MHTNSSFDFKDKLSNELFVKQAYKWSSKTEKLQYSGYLCECPLPRVIVTKIKIKVLIRGISWNLFNSRKFTIQCHIYIELLTN